MRPMPPGRPPMSPGGVMPRPPMSPAGAGPRPPMMPAGGGPRPPMMPGRPAFKKGGMVRKKSK